MDTDKHGQKNWCKQEKRERGKTAIVHAKGFFEYCPSPGEALGFENIKMQLFPLTPFPSSLLTQIDGQSNVSGSSSVFIGTQVNNVV
jgi:hypothetical protein